MPMEFQQPAVRTEKLSKRFGDLCAVDRLDLQVERGTMYALVGPDGAGKTTSLRMMCGIIPPTEGRVEVLGFDVQRKRRELKHRLGYLSQGFSLYEDLTVDENIEFFAEIHQVEDLTRRRQELLEFTRLSRFCSAGTVHTLLQKAGIEVYSIQPIQPGLEDVFIGLIGQFGDASDGAGVRK